MLPTSSPGFSYDKFLKAYECPQTKGFFPYEWMDSLEKLEHSSLPPHEAFYSTLTNKNISRKTTVVSVAPSEPILILMRSDIS